MDPLPLLVPFGVLAILKLFVSALVLDVLFLPRYQAGGSKGAKPLGSRSGRCDGMNISIGSEKGDWVAGERLLVSFRAICEAGEEGLLSLEEGALGSGDGVVELFRNGLDGFFMFGLASGR